MMKEEKKAKKEKEKRYDNDFPSVTEVIGKVLRKVGLEMWFKYHTAQECNMLSEKGKIVGTQIHKLLKAYIEGKTVNLETDYEVEVTNAIKSFLEFRSAMPWINLKWAELKMTSELYKVNGTLDCLAKSVGFNKEEKVETPTIILDWKTGECKAKEEPPIYVEHLVQVCAYSMIYEELYKERIEEAWVVVFAKDKIAYNVFRLHRLQILECFNNIFLPALQIYKTVKLVESSIREHEKGQEDKEEENV